LRYKLRTTTRRRPRHAASFSRLARVGPDAEAAAARERRVVGNVLSRCRCALALHLAQLWYVQIFQ